jgi:hypothetical protein
MKNENLQKPVHTLEELLAVTRENERILKETYARNERILKETRAENDRKLAEMKAMYEKSKLERKQELEEQDRAFAKKIAENDRLIKANSKEIGGISRSNGEVAEAYFINSFKKHPYFAGQEYQFLDANMSRYSKALDMKDEYDLLLYNGVSVVIIEIKYNARKEDVEQVLQKAETFKKLVPQYKDYALYLGLAGLHVYKNTEQEAKRQGVAIVTQVGKKMVINDKYLKVF